MLATDSSQKHPSFKSPLPLSSKIASNDTRTPDLAADLELSFIDHNSFILSPQHPSLQSPTMAMMKKRANIVNSSLTKSIKTPLLQKPAIPTLKEQDKMIDEASREIFSLKMKIFYLEERIKKMTPKHMEEALNENVELNVRNGSLTKDVAMLKAHLQTAEQALRQSQLEKAEQQQFHQKQLLTLESKIEQQNSRLNAHQSEWESLEKERNEWKAKSTHSQTHLQSIIDNIKREHDQSISKYQEQLDQKEVLLKQKQFEFQSKIDDSIQKYNALQYSQENTTTKNEYDMKVLECTKIKSEYDLIKRELGDIKAEYEAIKNKYANTKNEYQAMSGECANLKSKYEIMKVEHESMKNEYINIKDDYIDIKRQLEHSNSKSTSDLQVKLKDNTELKRISDKLEQEKGELMSRIEEERKQRELVIMESQKLQLRLTGIESENQTLLHKIDLTSSQYQKALQDEQSLRNQLNTEVNRHRKREEDLTRQLETSKVNNSQVVMKNMNQYLEDDLSSLLELVQDTIMREHSSKFSNLIQQLNKTPEGDRTTLLIQILKRVLRYLVMRTHDLQIKVDDYHVLYDELGKLVVNWPLPLILSTENQKDDKDGWTDEYSMAVHMPSVLSRLKYIQGIYHMQLNNLYSFMNKLDRYIYEELLDDKNTEIQAMDDVKVAVKHPILGPMIPLISSIMLLQTHIMDGLSRISSSNTDKVAVASNQSQLKQLIEKKEREIQILSSKYHQLEKEHDTQKEELTKRERIIAKALRRLEKINMRREAINEQLKLTGHPYN